MGRIRTLLTDFFLTVFVSLFLSVSSRDVSRCPPIVRNLGHYADSHGETCYMFVNREKYWTDARSYCLETGGDMLEVHDEDTMLFIRRVLDSDDLGWSRNGVWIGAHDRHKEGHWQWASGRPVTYTYWDRADNQPSSILNTGLSFEDCACMRRKEGWKWHDYPCEALFYKYNFICQFRRTTTTTTTTTTTPSPTTMPTTVRSTVLPSVKTTLSTYAVASVEIQSSVSVILGKLSLREGGVQQVDRGAPATGNQVLSDSDYHTGGEKDDNRGAMVAYILGSISLLLILLTLFCILYRRRQRKKQNPDDMPPQFENLSYAQLRQNEANEQADARNCFTTNQMNSIYEEVNKPVDHGVNYYTSMNAAACAANHPLPKVNNVKVITKENNATSEKVAEKAPAVNIVNNQLYDVEDNPEGASAEPASPFYVNKDDMDSHIYEDMK